MSRHPIFFAILAAFWLGSSAQANVGETYGFGSRSAALAGNGVAWGFEGFSAYANPAGLPFSVQAVGKLGASFGLLAMDPEFLPIQNVVLENNYVSDKTPVRTGDVDTSYRMTLGQEIGLVYKFNESSQLTAGLTLFFPLNQFAYMDSGEAFAPEYVLYRGRTQRPQIELGAGMLVSSHVRVGAGFHVGFSLTTLASVYLNSDPAKPSTMRFNGTLKPKAAPYLGVLFTPGEHPETFSLGAVIRFPATVDNVMNMNTAARLLGGTAAFDLNFGAISALFYDPGTIELGTSWEHSPGWRFYAQADYQFWHLFQSPAIQIGPPNINTCATCTPGLVVSAGNNPTFSFQNVLIPRVGEEFSLGSTVVRVGYAYRPSSMTDLPTGAGNFLDPAKHMFNAGVGVKFQHFLGYDTPTQLDLHASYHQFVTQHIVKTAGNEAGNGADQKIGAPGYDAGGKIIGGGLSLTLSI